MKITQNAILPIFAEFCLDYNIVLQNMEFPKNAEKTWKSQRRRRSLRIFDRRSFWRSTTFHFLLDRENAMEAKDDTQLFFPSLLSHQLLYFHLKVKNSDRAETVILTPTIIVALELPFLFFLMTNYRMTLCENTILGLVIYITFSKSKFLSIWSTLTPNCSFTTFC